MFDIVGILGIPSYVQRPPFPYWERVGLDAIDIILPGVDPATIEVTLEGRRLKISGKLEPGVSDPIKSHWMLNENGTFSMDYTVAADVGQDKIAAAYHNGILTIRMRSDVSQPKRIAVSVD